MKVDKKIIILSGEISVGKTSLADQLNSNFGFKILRTKEGIERYFSNQNKKLPNRESLQKAGEKLDRDSNGQWLLSVFQKELLEFNYIVIDSARIIEQVNFFREAYGRNVFHIHLTASTECLQERFLRREENESRDTEYLKANYRKIKANRTEKQVPSLKEKADLVLQTDRYTEEDNLTRVASFLKLLHEYDNKLVDVIIGGQFGSEGKGHVVGYLAPEYDCLVRTGGPNAGHTVFAKPHNQVFHIIPSGASRATDAKLVIGPGTFINIDKLLKEIKQYKIDPSRVTIDENSNIISEKDIEYEVKHQKIGSTSQGVGAAGSNNILNRLKEDNSHKAKNFNLLQPYLGSSAEEFQRLFRANKKILLEGTQGSLLSLHHGEYPYVTSRDTTAAGCLAEAGLPIQSIRKIILVIRTYPIRVKSPDNGTSGKFRSKEISYEELAYRSGIDIEKLKRTETTTTTKKQRRIAEFSWEMLRKSCELNSPTDIALTFTDYLGKENEKARRFEQLTDQTREFIEEIEMCSYRPVSLITTRFNYRSIIDRRNWK